MNLPQTKLSELDAWLPDQWKLQQAARNEALNRAAPRLRRARTPYIAAFSCYALSWRNIATLAPAPQDVVRSPLNELPAASAAENHRMRRIAVMEIQKVGRA